MPKHLLTKDQQKRKTLYDRKHFTTLTAKVSKPYKAELLDYIAQTGGYRNGKPVTNMNSFLLYCIEFTRKYECESED
jgi:hypothetical protein